MTPRPLPRFPALAASGLALGGLLCTPALAEPAAPSASRQGELVHLVRQECGACHGLTLSGGLGAPLTPEALRERPEALLVATILHGRPGTAMAGWKAFVTEQEAEWVVRELKAGFPQEASP